jgi:hypothetical protein
MHRQIVKRASRVAIAGAAVALLAGAAHATDPQSEGRIRVAAAGDGGMPPYQRPAQGDVGRDIWQLVQNTATDQDSSAQVPVDAATILAAFHASAPESTEEELAKQHGLEIVRRMTLPSLNLRVVTYRARDGSNPAEVVQRLRADQRVSSAQMNVAYRAVEPDDTKVSRSEPPLNATKEAKQPAPVGKRAATRSASANAAGQLPRSTAATERVSMHSGLVRATAADVLAGGL